MKRKIGSLLLMMIIAVWGCKKDKSVLSEVETYIPEFIGSNSATIGCRVVSNGGSEFLECGIYIGPEADPESTGAKIQIGNDTGLWYGRLTGLSPETEYFLKAYALNSVGESLGEVESFLTTARVSDFDENTYETVKIGTRIWMAEDLGTTHFRNGDALGTTTPGTLDISSENEPRYQWTYEGGDSNPDEYGKLYTWYAVSDTRNLCPDGWHVSTDAEWTEMETLLGGYLYAGSSLKESGNSHWIPPYNMDASNISGFTALPGGQRDAAGTFSLLRNEGYWWTATSSTTEKSWSRQMRTSSQEVSRLGINKNWGLSVRCVKDN